MLRTRQEELLETRLEGLRRSLTTTDRVLSGRNVLLTFSRDEDAEHPAHSAGDRITIELGKIPNLGSNSALVEILGLNYHELAHVRYGVEYSQLVQRVAPRRWRFLEAYRALEEARVETLLAAKYAKMKKYFAYPVIKYFVKDRSAWSTAFLFTYGRRYLPLKIRSTFREVFDKEFGGADQFADIIDQYRVLSFTTDDRVMTGAVLIDRFAKLLEEYKVPTLMAHESASSTDVGDDEFEGTSKNRSGRDTEEDSEKAQQEAQEQDEKEEQGEDGSGFDDQEAEEDEDGESEGGDGEDGSDADGDQDSGEPEPESEPDGAGGGQDQEDGDPEQDSGDSSGDGAGDGDQESDSGTANGGDSEDDSADPPGASSPDARAGIGGKDQEPDYQGLEEQLEDLAGQMSEVLETVLDDQDIQNDVDNLRSAMDDESGLSSSLDRHARSNEENLKPVTAGMLTEADRLKDVLRQIWAQMEPGWMYGLSEGNRIDMQRASQAQSADDYDSIYADWQEGQQENSGLEVVIVADESFSMYEDIPPQPGNKLPIRVQKTTVVSRQIWELMYALQEVEAHVTVLSFHSLSRTMYDRQDRVTTKGYVELGSDGGTNPTEALVEASRIFNSSEMPNKLLVTISDGDWDGYARMNCPAILDQMQGVTKVAAVIDTAGKNYTFHLSSKFDVVRRTNGPIFEVVADAVTRIVEGNLNS